MPIAISPYFVWFSNVNTCTTIKIFFLSLTWEPDHQTPVYRLLGISISNSAQLSWPWGWEASKWAHLMNRLLGLRTGYSDNCHATFTLTRGQSKYCVSSLCVDCPLAKELWNAHVRGLDPLIKLKSAEIAIYINNSEIVIDFPYVYFSYVLMCKTILTHGYLPSLGFCSRHGRVVHLAEMESSTLLVCNSFWNIWYLDIVWS